MFESQVGMNSPTPHSCLWVAKMSVMTEKGSLEESPTPLKTRNLPKKRFEIFRFGVHGIHKGMYTGVEMQKPLKCKYFGTFPISRISC